MKLRTYTRAEHGVNIRSVDSDALQVIAELQGAGFSAYLVGGGVRDLLFGLRPKDFDVSTSARPEEVKRLFGKRCLLIGRRFRLAHLRFGHKIIEVSTFRSGDTTSTSLITHDNRWGNEEEDVLRRDFTINALFYDPAKEEILDYVGGVHDLHQRLLRTIGNPDARFRQDPVRMIRMLKFQARFGLNCEASSLEALSRCRHQILNSAHARVLEEILKMLESGKAQAFFQLLSEHRFIDLLLPCFEHFLAGPTKKTAYAYLRAVDAAHSAGEVLRRPVLLSALIFPILEQELQLLSQDRLSPLSMRDITHLTHTLLHAVSTSCFVHFPKRLLILSSMIMLNQFRMAPLQGPPKLHARFHSAEDFSLALEFLRVRCRLNTSLSDPLSAWEEVSARRHKETSRHEHRESLP